MSLKPWWRVAVPHRDIREGRLDESVFAASLGDVFHDRGPMDYRDPAIFFERTYLTGGLSNLIGAVLLRLSGRVKGGSVIQIQTPFGGGKTHALLALYHVFKHGDRISHLPAVRKILEKNGVSSVPQAKVVVFAGEYMDALKGRTLWGELAHQLGSYGVMEEYDKRRVAPGKELIVDVLERNKPVLILMDEILQYVVPSMAVVVGEGTLKGQVMVFLKALTEAVVSVDGCALIATLPSSPYESYEEPEKAEGVLSELQKIFGRMEKVYTPVEGGEIYEVIRKRLFEDLGDPTEHRRVAEKYFRLYQDLGEDVPPECRDLTYKEKLVQAYPFHPETIDILFERWATIPNFQRTRGALRLLAQIVADLYGKDPAPLIQPAQINFSNQAIRSEFIKHIGKEYEGVVKSDLVDKASEIDRRMGSEYSKLKVAIGLAASIFFYSFSGGERKGVTIQRLRLAFLREGVPAAIVMDALRRLEDQLWYLHVEKNVYYFSNKAGLNRIIRDREETVGDEDIEAEVRKRIESIRGTDFEVYLWPKTSSDVPDNKKLKLIVLDPQHQIVGPQCTLDNETKRFAQEIIDKYSVSFRTHKNTLILAIARSNEYNGLRSLTRRFLALDSIKQDKQIMNSLVEEDKEKVENKLKDVDSSIATGILSTYRCIAKASKDGIQTFDLGIPIIGEKSLTKRVKEYLVEQGVMLTTLLPTAKWFESLLPKGDQRKTFMEIWEAFLKYPELPMLENENVLKNTIVKGVQEGIFGILINGKIHYRIQISPLEISYDTQIVGRETAEKELTQIAGKTTVEAKEEPTQTSTTGVIIPAGATADVSGAGKETMTNTGKGGVTKLTLRVVVPWDKLSYIMRGVIGPLQTEEAKINLEIKIEAESEKGISQNTIDMKIKETLNQIGAKILEEDIK